MEAPLSEVGDDTVDTSVDRSESRFVMSCLYGGRLGAARAKNKQDAQTKATALRGFLCQISVTGSKE
jgi:hypothetical protein